MLQKDSKLKDRAQQAFMTGSFYVLLYRTVFTVALTSPFIKAFLITMIKLPLGSSDISAID